VAGICPEIAGYTVLWAVNGKIALEYLDSNSIDVVLTDVNMPHVNGIELLSFLRQHRAGIAAFVMTGDSVLMSERRSRELGAVGFFLKPCTGIDLVKAISEKL
jgi:CheY-like chemotaxis protein